MTGFVVNVVSVPRFRINDHAPLRFHLCTLDTAQIKLQAIIQVAGLALEVQLLFCDVHAVLMDNFVYISFVVNAKFQQAFRVFCLNPL